MIHTFRTSNSNLQVSDSKASVTQDRGTISTPNPGECSSFRSKSPATRSRLGGELSMGLAWPDFRAQPRLQAFCHKEATLSILVIHCLSWLWRISEKSHRHLPKLRRTSAAGRSKFAEGQQHVGQLNQSGPVFIESHLPQSADCVLFPESLSQRPDKALIKGQGGTSHNAPTQQSGCYGGAGGAALRCVPLNQHET